MRRLFLMIGISALIAATPVIAQVSGAQLTAYKAAVSGFYNSTAEKADQVAGFLPRIDELPAVFLVAKEAGVDPEAVAKQRYDGVEWKDIVTGYQLGMALFHVEARGFVPSPIYQPILDKFDDENPGQWNRAPLTDRDVVNLANLKFIADSYDYSMYRVMALRDKGQTFTQINEQVFELTQKQPQQGKTATAGF